MTEENKSTLVLGASPNPSRYSNLAVHKLLQHHHEVLPVGIREGEIEGVKISKEFPAQKNIDTVTLYLNPQRQKEYYARILNLHPKRIIFNPGTENPELEKLAEENGIEPVEACTLVMLATGQY